MSGSIAFDDPVQFSLQSWLLAFSPFLVAASQIAHLLFLVPYAITFPDFIPIIVPAPEIHIINKTVFICLKSSYLYLLKRKVPEKNVNLL